VGIEVRSETEFPREELARLVRFGRAVLAALGRSRSTVSLLIVDDAAIRDLNRRWRRIDRATDVLSFPAGDDPSRVLGDVVISAPRAALQARRYGVTTTEELRRLLVHGILHLMGYDHVKPEERRQMRGLEEKTLRAAARASRASRTTSAASGSRRRAMAAAHKPRRTAV
jgi:probable rRNA maturation factor